MFDGQLTGPGRGTPAPHRTAPHRTAPHRTDGRLIIGTLPCGSPPDVQRVAELMAQDAIGGRPTEIDFLNGVVIEKGADCGVPTPLCAAVVDAVKAFESDSHPDGHALIERLAALATSLHAA